MLCDTPDNRHGNLLHLKLLGYFLHFVIPIPPQLRFNIGSFASEFWLDEGAHFVRSPLARPL